MEILMEINGKRTKTGLISFIHESILDFGSIKPKISFLLRKKSKAPAKSGLIEVLFSTISFLLILNNLSQLAWDAGIDKYNRASFAK